jgi:hypothetical protein
VICPLLLEALFRSFACFLLLFSLSIAYVFLHSASTPLTHSFVAVVVEPSSLFDLPPYTLSTCPTAESFVLALCTYLLPTSFHIHMHDL